jgi:hypothetical protein
LPTKVQEYEYARAQGFPGTFTDYQDATRNPLYQDKYKEVSGAERAKRDFDLVDSAEAAAQSLPKIYDTLDLIENSDAITGAGAELFKGIERLRAQFMGDVSAGKRVADTETLDAFLGSEVFPLINSLGIGARGLDTPAEREFLRQVMTGTISLNRQTLVRLTELRRDAALDAVKKYNSAVSDGRLDRFYATQGEKPRKIEAPQRPSATTEEIPASVPADIRELWQFMPPEDRKLWLK